jgi:WD40 repeat protein
MQSHSPSPEFSPTTLARACCVGFFLVLVVTHLSPFSISATSNSDVDYARNIQPIFNANCTVCHNNADRMGGLSLESYDELTKGGAKGHEVVSGDSAKSRLVGMIEGDIKPAMPPGGRLKPAEIKAIKDWIDAGALPPKQGEMNATSAAATVITAAPTIPDTKPMAAVTSPVTSLAFRPDGGAIVATGFKEVRILGNADARAMKSLTGMNSAARTVAYSPDGKLVAAGGGLPARQGEITIWDAATGKVRHNLQGHKDYVYSIAFSPDGKLLASSSYDRLVKIWDVQRGLEFKTLKDHIDAVYPVAFSPDGKLLASGSADRSVKLWNVQTGERLYTLSDSTDVVYTLAFHPSGKQISAAGADKSIRTWDITASGGTLKNSFIAHDDEIVQIVYSPDGLVLASISADRSVKLWDVETGQLIKAFEKQPRWAEAIAFSPEGRTLAVGSFDGSVKVYSVQTGKLVQIPSRASRKQTRVKAKGVKIKSP